MNDYQTDDEVFEPSEESFMLHETYPTCPGSSTDVETSSGWSIPTSVTSYFLWEWHDTILSPEYIVGQSKTRPIRKM